MAAHPLAAVARRRDRVAAAITGTLGPTGFDAARAAEAALRILPARVDYSAVYRSLLPLAGPTVSPATIREASWAVAGDIPGLRSGRPVYPPTLPGTPTKVVIQFLAARRVPPRGPADDPKTRYRVRVVSGRGCPLVIEVTWPDRFVRYRAVHPTGLGFARPPRGNRTPGPGRPFHHPDTLVGMLARVTLEVDPRDGKPKLSDVRGTDAFRTYNRALTELRWRAGGFRCPFNFTHHCHDCLKGQASCPAAVRPLDVIPMPCGVCHTPDAPTDPAWPGIPCIKCVTRRTFTHRKPLNG